MQKKDTANRLKSSFFEKKTLKETSPKLGTVEATTDHQPKTTPDGYPPKP